MAHTILVADDERSNLEIILNHFVESDEDYTVIAAPNGEIACKLAVTRQPDLILMDWNMPVMSGMEAIDKLKSDPATQNIPVLMVSARSSADDFQQALNKGAMDYIRKPVDSIELLARVKTALRLYDNYKEIERLKELISTLKK